MSRYETAISNAACEIAITLVRGGVSADFVATYTLGQKTLFLERTDQMTTTKTAKSKSAVRASKKTAPAQPYVVVRTFSAGVHVGHLVRRDGKQVELRDARRVWKWVGANTLHEIATAGVGVGSKVSVPVSSILITEAIEIIACTEAGEASLKDATWAG